MADEKKQKAQGGQSKPQGGQPKPQGKKAKPEQAEQPVQSRVQSRRVRRRPIAIPRACATVITKKFSRR